MNNPVVQGLPEVKCQAHLADWRDVDVVVDLRNASSQRTLGTDLTAVNGHKCHGDESDIDLSEDSKLLLDGEAVVTYPEPVIEPPYILLKMVAAVHPADWGCGLGTQRVQWTVKRVLCSINKAPNQAVIFIHNSIVEPNQSVHSLLSTHHFSVVRDFVHLGIDIDSQPSDPVFPQCIEVRLLGPEDWEKIGLALSEAFINHWGNIICNLQRISQVDESAELNPFKIDPRADNPAYFNSPGLFFVARDREQDAGSRLCNVKTVEFLESDYIGSFSVRRPRRRHGVGMALTLHALNVFYLSSATQVRADTDGDSLKKAYHLYQTAGMQIYHCELVYEKRIRPGCDYLIRKMIN
jgi:hypothetical protein